MRAIRLHSCQVKLAVAVLDVAAIASAVVPATLKAADPPELQRMLQAAIASSNASNYRESVKILGRCTELFPKAPMVYYLRGRDRFRLGQFKGSVEDFDRLIELAPARKKSLWERGISCYYAGQFRAGAEQFVSYQTYDDTDVENAVWHFLCQARIHGVDQARAKILPVRQDTRIPMSEVYGLYAGTKSVESVLSAAATAPGSPEAKRRSQFYGHLYVGLFYEVDNRDDLARKHIETAAAKYKIDHYMGDVATAHAARWASSSK